jgi:hypothetical protein
VPLSFKQIKAGFFDRGVVLRGVAKFHVKVQGRFGAYARTVMRNSLKYKKGSAPTGQPPHAHRSKRFTREKKNRKTGAAARQSVSPLRELIFFSRDPVRDSVVIGPLQFGKQGAGVLEHGGVTTVRDRETGRERTVRISPHPFARPAGRKAAERLPELLRKMAEGGK